MSRKITYYETKELMPNTGKPKIIGVYDDSLEDFKFFRPNIELGKIVSEKEYDKQEEDFKNSDYLKRSVMAYTSKEDWEKRYPNDNWDEIMKNIKC